MGYRCHFVCWLLEPWSIDSNELSFAMLVGQPPFQSSSQNEIYRRARSVDYAWPESKKILNDIPKEAKDLVTLLLKVEAEERPDPDQVIGHAFFSMHGGNAMPLVMEESSCRQIPNFLDHRASPRGDVIRDGTERLSLRTLARHCGVGRLTGDGEAQAAVGGDVDTSLYGECHAEEVSGAAPKVPLPKDMVYISKFPSTTWPSLQADEESASETVMQDSVTSLLTIESVSQKRVPERVPRSAVPSHAATLRAAHVSSKVPLAKQSAEQAVPIGRPALSSGSASASQRTRRGLLHELPVRPTYNASGPAGLEAKTLARNPRVTRQKKVHILDDEPLPVVTGASESRRPITKDEFIDEAYSDPDAKRRELAARTRARIASNVLKELAVIDPSTGKSSSESETLVNRSRQTSDTSKQSITLIGPDEVVESMANTKPDDVLRQLKRLHKALETSLKNLTPGQDQSGIEELMVKNNDLKHRPVVVKWVDYTNKFGIGYILVNGTVGCVFKGDETNNPTCVVVARAEAHFKNRKISNYADKHQIVPSKGTAIEFIENCGQDGLKRVFVSPSQYQVKVSDSDVPDKLSPGIDLHDHEKRKKLSLWDKFGKYMTQTLGKSDSEDSLFLYEPVLAKSRRNHAAGPFLKFYQRLGNVGIWGFGNGPFQFNFPDHTKLLVSENGTWLDFYHLSIDAIRTLRAGRVLEANALADRAVLCYPTAVMLSGHYQGHDFKDLVTENQLEAKVAFVRDVVGFWAKEGGLGCMGRKKGVKWEGTVEKGGKLVWVTVGAKGGDGRYEMPPSKA